MLRVFVLHLSVLTVVQGCPLRARNDDALQAFDLGLGLNTPPASSKVQLEWYAALTSISRLRCG